jgi:transcriptional regulator with XRE-family HTH domain
VPEAALARAPRFVPRVVPNPPKSRRPSAIDIHIGNRIRMARLLKKTKAEALAVYIGVSFQQLQKYETGDNRITAARVAKIAEFLALPITFFFEGIGNKPVNLEDQDEATVAKFLATPEGVSISLNFMSIRASAIRRRVVELVDSIAKGGV